MLTELLARLRAGGVRRVADLARELDTTPEMVELMLEELARLGYLRSLEQHCGAACESCRLSGLCAAGGGRVWMLAEGDGGSGRQEKMRCAISDMRDAREGQGDGK